jgi:hypothetical protein
MKNKLFNLKLFTPEVAVFPKQVFKKKFDVHLFMNLEDWFNNAEDYNDLRCFLEAINEPYLYCAVPDCFGCPDFRIETSKKHADFVAAYTRNSNDATDALGMRMSPTGFWYGQSEDWAMVSDLTNNIYIVGLDFAAALNFKADFPEKYFDVHQYLQREIDINAKLGIAVNLTDKKVRRRYDEVVKRYK